MDEALYGSPFESYYIGVIPYMAFAQGPIVYSYYRCKNVPSYVVPSPRKPKIFRGYRSIAKYVFKTRLPMSYVQNVKCKLDGEDK